MMVMNFKQPTSEELVAQRQAELEERRLANEADIRYANKKLEHSAIET